MLSRADMIGKIQQLYRQDRPIPYLTFMHMFNDLLADPKKVIPEEPGEGIQEQFRAACMCAAVGVFDTEGRAEQRLKEFREKVYPVWKAKLPPAEFAIYDDILKGIERRRRAGKDQELAAQAAGDRSRELLRRLGLGQAAEEPVPAQPAVELPHRLRRPRTFANVDEFCKALRSGALKVEFLPRQKAGDFARYSLEEHEVTVKLARADDQAYVVLTVGIGRSSVPDALERVDLFAAEMGYLRMADFAYMRKDGQLIYTLSVGPEATNLACASAQERPEDDAVRRIEHLHRDLGELAERMRP